MRWICLLVSIVLLTGCSANATQPVQIPPATAGGDVLESKAIPPEETETASLPTESRGETPFSPSETPGPEQPDANQVKDLPCSTELTSANQEGPYYTSGSPEKTSLIEPGVQGEPVLIQGYVFNETCKPISSAVVDFWQADSGGVYDNTGFRLRGHVQTDEKGFYAIETIAPGLYPGRPPHIHVKVFAADGRELLTTQIYFPGSEESGDVQAAPDLLVSFQGEDALGRQRVIFNFIVHE